MHSEIDWSKPRRQSKVVILLALLKMVKLMWPIMVFLVARFFLKNGDMGDKGFSTLLWSLSGVLVIFILFRINDIGGFFYFRFCIVGQQLIIFSGFLVKKQTELPLSRIQAIHTRQTFLHKLTHTCKLIIDTAGTEKAEMEIEALDIDIAKEFQLALKPGEPRKPGEQAPVKADGKENQPLLQLGLKDTLKLCISENHLKTFLVLIGFLIGKMDDIREYLGFDSFGYMEKQASSANATVQAILFLFITGMMFSILVSFVRVILRFYGFTIQLSQKDFVMKWGLLETQQKHIPFNKVQLLSWRSNFARRLMGVSILRLHATAEDESKDEQKVQVPVTNPGHLKTIARCYQPDIPASHYPFFGIQANYISRQIIVVGFPISIVAAAGLYYVVGWYALFTLLWLIYFGISRWLYHRNFKIWISNEAIQVEKGVWGRENTLVNFGNIQQVAIKNTPYKRKHHLADLQIHTPGVSVNIPFLKKEDADFIADFLLANIEFEVEINQSPSLQKHNAAEFIRTE